MRVSLSDAAINDLDAAVDWYLNERAFVAAQRLADEVEAALATLAVFPLLGAAGENGTRMFTLQKFPYSLVYRAMDDEVRVIAVAHHSRKPGRWAIRL